MILFVVMAATYSVNNEKVNILMQTSGRLSAAVHIFTCIDVFGQDCSITSEFLASSININPVTVRRILLQLKAAGLINISRGRGSMSAARPLDEITFYDVYRAVERADNELFHINGNPNPDCPVGRNINKALSGRLNQVQEVMEAELKSITVADVVKDTRRYIEQEAIGDTKPL